MNKTHPRPIGRKNHQPIDKLGAIALSARRGTPSWGSRTQRLGDQCKVHFFLSLKLVCDALHRASPDPERLGNPQDTDTLASCFRTFCWATARLSPAPHW
jgi:hypothetical protein